MVYLNNISADRVLLQQAEFLLTWKSLQYREVGICVRHSAPNLTRSDRIQMKQPTPQWIARMYPPRVGQDHLGLGSISSDQILPALSPDINMLIIHPRYHSFYTFLLDEFWRRDLSRSYAAWVKFYQPREFIFSLGGVSLRSAGARGNA